MPCGLLAHNQVAPTGTLALSGDAFFRRTPTTVVADNINNSNARSVDNVAPPSAPPVLRNLGTLSFPRGFSLTVDGGIEQGPTGATLVALPAPLYLPPRGVSYEGRWHVEAGGGGKHPLVVESGVAKLGGAMNVSVTGGEGEGERCVGCG